MAISSIDKNLPNKLMRGNITPGSFTGVYGRLNQLKNASAEFATHIEKAGIPKEDFTSITDIPVLGLPFTSCLSEQIGVQGAILAMSAIGRNLGYYKRDSY